MGLIRQQGFVVTSGPVQAYGGVRLTDDEVEHMNAIAKDKFFDPGFWYAHHDERLPTPPVKIHAVELRRTEDGNLGIWVDVEMDEETLERAGEIRAWSVSLVTEKYEHTADTQKPHLNIYADAAHFDLEDAVQELRRAFNVRGGQLYQFSILPPPKIILEFPWELLRDIGVGVLAAALFEGLRRFIPPLKADKSIFIFRSKSPSGASTEGRLETDDPEALRRAIEKLPDLQEKQGGQDFDNETGEWRGYL